MSMCIKCGQYEEDGGNHHLDVRVGEKWFHYDDMGFNNPTEEIAKAVKEMRAKMFGNEVKIETVDDGK